MRAAMAERVLIADGAMGTMLQEADLTLDDFLGYEGCNEILNITRPEVVEAIHAAYFAVGVDAVETNTFGTNYGNLLEYGIVERTEELAEAGARIARRAADAAEELARDGRPRFVIGSIGPGTKLPSLGHAPYALLRDIYQDCARGLINGGADMLLIETAQDLLQAKSAVVGCQRALKELNSDIPIIVQVTVETTGTMLLGSEIGAALTTLEALRIDGIGLNCATGPAEMSEYLRYLSRNTFLPITCQPNAGLPQLGPNGAIYPLSPEELADAHDRFTRDYGLAVVGGCCGTTPQHLAAVVERVGGRAVVERDPKPEAGVASLYSTVPFDQDASYLAIGERTNANGSKAFREAMIAGDWNECVEIAHAQTQDGAHLLDVCVDYVGRDGVADVREVVGRLATASTLPLVVDSTEPAVLQAALELIGGRAVVNSVNFEDGDQPGSRWARIMPLVAEHGAAVVALTIDEEGQARTTEDKLRIAERLIGELTQTWGMNEEDILIDCLTFPIATGQEETRRDGIHTLEAIRALKAAHPRVHTTLGLSNISFGLNPASRIVVNSVFLHEAVEAGLDSAIVHAAKILPMAQIPDEQRQVALDLVYDRRTYNDDGELTYDPLAALLDLFADVSVASLAEARAEELAALPLGERLSRRIIDGARKGLEEDLAAAIAEGHDPIEIINTYLLDGMRVVGERFGSGEMQLPFVLTSAEVMKTAVAYLEPLMEKGVDGEQPRSKGRIVLATVKGDVHDIGKNLVDIILSNNGYEVVNIGIKQPISEILKAAREHDADVIGMSGLLVKSTVVMKENLEEMNLQGAAQWPVILGGAALNRAFVEDDLAQVYEGEVRYARDAFEGLRLMDALVALRRGEEGVELPPLRRRRVPLKPEADVEKTIDTKRSDVSVTNAIPTPPFWGSRVVRGLPLADYASYLDERATFMGQWGLKAGRGDDAASYEELVETEGRPRLRGWLERVRAENLLEAAVTYGYFPCYSEGNDLVVVHHAEDGTGGEPGTERMRFSFPRQGRDRRLCLADFYRPKESGELDVVAFQLVTVGSRVSDYAAVLFADNAYRDYLELHGLSVQLTEALAEYWHKRVRDELGFATEDPEELAEFFAVGYRGARYSFGYPACPDLEQRRLIMELLDPSRIGVELSEELQLHPEQSTDAIIVHHPEAKYFNAS